MSRSVVCSRVLPVFLLVGMLFQQMHPPAPVHSQVPAAPLSGEEIILPGQTGLEKLSPDLKDAVEGLLANPPAAFAPGRQTQKALLVSALIRSGNGPEQYFTQSVSSRSFGAYQWVVGEIQPAQLLKLASHPGVIGVFSRETFQTAEAPGLDQLRSRAPYPSASEARALLDEGGPDLLRQHLQQSGPRAPSAQAIPPGQPAAADHAPGAAGGLLDIHDARRVHSQGITGQGVTVAVVDTGVDFSHPDLQGTQAVIQSGPYAGWPFSYDTVSGAGYALNPNALVDPQNFWSFLGYTQYARTFPVEKFTCAQAVCEGDLLLGLPEGGTLLHATWPNTSKSGVYYYTVHPDSLLTFAAYLMGINYPSNWGPPVIIVADEGLANRYDTVYADLNYNQVLGDAGEKMTRTQPLGGADLTGDGVWDLSGGMLTWISDGANHPPGVSVIYPDALQGAKVPGAGRLLAFVSDQQGHGTNCASEIAGQGRITDPQAIGPSNPLFAGGASIGGTGAPVIQSIAPGAKIAAFQNGFALPLDAWTLASLGMDGQENTGDEVQIISNSWGDSRTVEDGWDPVSRYAHYLAYEIAPTVSFLAATGNGGHGYGTETSPGGGSILDVGASTAYGALRGFERVAPGQFVYGEVQPWSNRGPGALGDLAPDLVALGAWGTGAQPLNYYFGDGQSAYDIFGGTSMSTPVAAGGLALVYQAFRANPNNSRWPGWQEARSILLNSAQDLGYDVFVQGAGNFQAGRAVDIAAGRDISVSPQQWQAGEFRGTRYPPGAAEAAMPALFPAVLHPGDTQSQDFTITNATGEPVTLDIHQKYLQKTHEETFTFTYTPPRPNSKKSIPVYIENLTGLIDAHAPDLMRVQANLPYESFDSNQDESADQWWSIYLYNWTDLNGDGDLWVDSNRDGMVAQEEIDISAETGLYEFNRFTYGYPQSTILEASLGSQGLAQEADGTFLGLNCSYCDQSVTLQVKVTFYQNTTWDWLEIDQSQVTAAAGSTGVIRASLSIPPDAVPGAYASAIELVGSSGSILVPVVVQVAASSARFHFGRQGSQQAPFENGYLNGGFNWSWRYESGDWRTFYYDLPGGTARPGTSLLVDTRWSIPKTDIDTWVLGAAPLLEPALDSSLFGPQGMEVTGGSTDTYLIRGVFDWNTGSGSTHELVGAPVRDGLGMISLHNVLSGGGQLSDSFTGSVFEFSSLPASAEIQLMPESAQDPFMTGTQAITFSSTGDLPEGLQVRAYGFSFPEHLVNQAAQQDSPQNICTSSWVYQVDRKGLSMINGGLLEVSTRSAAQELDIDLYLFRDNGDEIWNCARDKLHAYSFNSGPQEKIKIFFPPDGTYWVLVHGYDVPEGTQPFDIHLRAPQGSQIQLRNLPDGPVEAGKPVFVQASFKSVYTAEAPAALEGLLLVGPPFLPTLIEVPISLRPQVLLYPKPVMRKEQRWLWQEPRKYTLSLANQGVQAEMVQVKIELPEGMLYQEGLQAALGKAPVYDPGMRTLSWELEAGAAERVELVFMAAAQAGFPSSKGVIHTQVLGVRSGQTWQVDTPVELNTYGFIFPEIRR